MNRQTLLCSAFVEGTLKKRTSAASITADEDVLISYSTPIAVIDRQRRVLYLNPTKYSVTTSRHQNTVAFAASQAGYNIIKVDLF